jgi:hypothetical protein
MVPDPQTAHLLTRILANQDVGGAEIQSLADKTPFPLTRRSADFYVALGEQHRQALLDLIGEGLRSAPRPIEMPVTRPVPVSPRAPEPKKSD